MTGSYGRTELEAGQRQLSLTHFTSLLSHFLRIWNNATLSSFELINSGKPYRNTASIAGDSKCSWVNNEDGDHIQGTDLKFPNTWVVF